MKELWGWECWAEIWEMKGDLCVGAWDCEATEESEIKIWYAHDIRMFTRASRLGKYRHLLEPKLHHAASRVAVVDLIVPHTIN